MNTGTFLVYQYCLKMWYLHSLQHVGVIQKLSILERKNDLVLSNTRVPVSGTWSILFPCLLMSTYELQYSFGEGLSSPLQPGSIWLNPLCKCWLKNSLSSFFNFNFYHHIWIQHEKCTQMSSTNQPSIIT